MEDKADRAQYLSVIGSLMYAMLGARPDIAYVVGLLGRFASDPSLEYWTALSLVKYLKHTRSLRIEYTNGLSELDGFSDADLKLATSMGSVMPT
jgi:hypothetical protein